MAGNGPRPGPLAILRGNIGLSRLSGGATPRSQDRLSTKILSSIVGVVATFAVGDLLLKRNYESYSAERNGIEQELRVAIQEFDQLEKDVVQLVENRRLAAQRLNLYAASHDVRGYLAFYTEYDESVDHWNTLRHDVQRRISSLTGCSSGLVADEVRQQVRNTVLSPESAVNRRHPRNGVRYVVPEEESESGAYSIYCPSRYLFYARPAGTVTDTSDVRSVFEVLQIMHAGFLDNLSRDIVACTKETDVLVKQNVAACHQSASSDELGGCIKRALGAFSPSKVCSPATFGALASFNQSRFFNIDYRWDMAREVLSHYRDTYVNARCQAKLGFWSDFWKWTCSGIRARLGI